MHGYRQGFELRAGDLTVARVLAGGQNPYPHGFSSGGDAVRFAEIIRREFPDHRVTRLDAASDFDGAGAWDRITAAGLAFADAQGLRVNHAGDWHRGIEGRTLYLGSRKSAVFVRIYEKGIQEGGEASPDWVRVEVVVRPAGDARMVAAQASAAEAWGFSSWTRDFSAMMLDLDVERVQMNQWRAPDDERAMRAVVSQYWRTFERRASAGGSWEALGVEIGKYIRDLSQTAPASNTGATTS